MLKLHVWQTVTYDKCTIPELYDLSLNDATVYANRFFFISHRRNSRTSSTLPSKSNRRSSSSWTRVGIQLRNWWSSSGLSQGLCFIPPTFYIGGFMKSIKNIFSWPSFFLKSGLIRKKIEAASAKCKVLGPSHYRLWFLKDYILIKHNQITGSGGHSSFAIHIMHT